MKNRKSGRWPGPGRSGSGAAGGLVGGQQQQRSPAALDAQARVTRDTSVELMQGEIYGSPPIFNPSLPERYRLTR